MHPRVGARGQAAMHADRALTSSFLRKAQQVNAEVTGNAGIAEKEFQALRAKCICIFSAHPASSASSALSFLRALARSPGEVT